MPAGQGKSVSIVGMPELEPLSGVQVVLTRPVGAAAAMRRRLRQLGAQVVQVPGMSLSGLRTDAARQALGKALAASRLIFTSPAAVRFAAQLAPLQAAGTVLAVGAGTAHALQRHGVADVEVPARQCSEGVLAMPSLRDIDGMDVGLVGACGGRRLLPDTLRQRGAHLHEAHVYTRGPARLDARHRDAVMALAPPLLVLVSSAAALQHVREGLGAQAWQRLCAGGVVVSSERLAAAARGSGFRRIHRAASARPQALIAAAVAAHV